MNQYMLDHMIGVATEAHSGQYDKGGSPYILHPLAVMQMLNTDDEELKCIAVGHDLLEDTWITFFQLYNLGFSKRVLDGIRALTKKKAESYEEYKQKVFSNHDAMLVKLCDLRHNSDIRRLKGVTDKDIARTGRYMQFYQEIKDKLNER